MKLTIEGTKEEIAFVLDGIRQKESPQRDHVTTWEYGYRPEKSGRSDRSEQPALITIGWRDSDRTVC